MKFIEFRVGKGSEVTASVNIDHIVGVIDNKHTETNSVSIITSEITSMDDCFEVVNMSYEEVMKKIYSAIEG